MPASCPAVGIRRHRHGNFLFSWNQTPKLRNKTGIFIPFRLGHVFDIHVYTVKIIFLYVFRNLSRKSFRICQSQLAAVSVPVVTEHRHYLYAHCVHLVYKLRTYGIYNKLTLRVYIKVRWGYCIKGTRLLYLCNLLGYTAAVKIGHTEFFGKLRSI